MTDLAPKVVRDDHRLEEATEKNREALARHRWHWTLDESNPDRVAVREYAREVGRGEVTVRDMVHGYAAWTVRGAPRAGLADDLERAKLHGDTLVATEAVAEAKGISVGAARRHHAPEVREVKAAAVERAERRGTKPADEMKNVAQDRSKAREQAKRATAERKERHTAVYLSIEGKIATASGYLQDVLTVTEGVEFSADERELLVHSIAKLRALLGLLDTRLGVATDTDWDAELARLGGDER